MGLPILSIIEILGYQFELSECISRPFICYGDFNYILSEEETLGG